MNNNKSLEIMNKLRSIALALSMISMSIIVASCSSDEPENKYQDRPTPAELNDEARGLLATSENELAVKLLQSVCNIAGTNENVCFTPYSAFMTLSMLANADDGSTRTLMLNDLGLNGEFKLSVLNQYNKEILDSIANNNHEILDVLHTYIPISLWHSNSLAIASDYSKLLSDYYNATDVEESPAGEGGKDAVNKWVNNNSVQWSGTQFWNKTIDDLATLVVPIFVSKTWTFPFSDKNSYALNFENIDGTVSGLSGMGYDVLVPIEHSKFDGVEMLALPYGYKKEMVMYVIMPSKGTDFGAFVKSLNAETIGDWISNLQKERIYLTMPRFSANFQYNLRELLSDKSGDWTFNKLLSSNSISLQNIPNAGYLEVGLNGNGLDNYVARPAITDKEFDSSYTHIMVDRPFVYMITYPDTKTVLVSGYVTKL
jgi:serine protease inhibitor